MRNLSAELLALGITQQMVDNCSLPSREEATRLVEAGEDIFGRPQKMTPATFTAWQEMQAAATADGIDLQLVSAYRSIEYQCEVIRKKLQDGRMIEDILCANAIPGHSEHHTGCALDLHSGDNIPLDEAFEDTPAFTWLNDNASRFNFYLTYPRDNADGINYEPWHWCSRE